MKLVAIHGRNGRAVVSYAGIARLPGGPVGEESTVTWLLRELEGQDCSFEEIADHIRARATERIGPYADRRYLHWFNIGFITAQNWGVIQIRNIHAPAGAPRRAFAIGRREFRRNGGVIMIAGDPTAVSDSDGALLNRMLRYRPDQPRNYQKLLAAITRRSAGFRISRECVTAFVPRDTHESIETMSHRDDGSYIGQTPFIFRGIDFTRDMEQLHETLERMR